MMAAPCQRYDEIEGSGFVSSFNLVTTDPQPLTYGNASENDYYSSYVVLKVFVVMVIHLISSIGNTLLFLIFTLTPKRNANEKGPSKKATPIIDETISALAVVGLGRLLLCGPIQAFCIVQDEWPFGNAFCQFQGFFGSLFRHLYIWYLAVLCTERYTSYLRPYEYRSSFTDLTIRVILAGLSLVVVTHVTAPLYNWGEYRYVSEFGICDQHYDAMFGCPYQIYLFISYSLPTIVMVVTTILLLRNGKAKSANRSRLTDSSCLLEEENEISTLVLLTCFAILFNLPRHLLDTLISCGGLCNVDVTTFFISYWLDNGTPTVLPILCLVLHSKVRLRTRCFVRKIRLEKDRRVNS